MRRLGQFFQAFSKDWLALMSGPPTVPLAAFALYVSNHTLKTLFAVLAVVCGFVATFRIWVKERIRLEEEVAKQARPEITASFQLLDGPSHTMLLLRNSSQAPAVGIQIQDIRNGAKVLRFFPPESLSGGTSMCISCRILESGWQAENNLSALFDSNSTMEQLLKGNTHSEILRMKITYNNLDSRLAQRTWVLSFEFWFDYQQNRLCSGTQSLDPM